MKPVLCVRNDRYDNIGITESALQESGRVMTRLDAFDPAADWPSVEAIAALIVFGGEMNVDEIEAHPYLLRERRMMQDAMRAGLPVLGICLGAQMLARVLGSRVYPAPIRELGFTPLRLTAAGVEDAVLGALGANPCVFQWHEDTFELPAGATLLATGDQIVTQAFRYGPMAWGVQFHFEVNREGIEEWLRVVETDLERVWGRTAQQVREEVAVHLQPQQVGGRKVFDAFSRQIKG